MVSSTGTSLPYFAVMLSIAFVDANPSNHWIQGPQGSSCTTVCEQASGSCNAEVMEAVNSVEKFEFVVGLIENLMFGECAVILEDDFYAEVVPSQATNGECLYNKGQTDRTTCDDSLPSDARICCCGTNCPVNDVNNNDLGDDDEIALTLEPSWIQGQQGNSCAEACERAGGSCNAEAMEGVDSVEKFEYVLDLIGHLRFGECTNIWEDDVLPKTVPSQAENGECYYDEGNADRATCEDYVPSDARICCCGAVCPTSD